MSCNFFRGVLCDRHVQRGEASLGCARLIGAPVAPGDEETLGLLRQGREAEAAPLPEELLAAGAPVELDRGLYLQNIRRAARGKAADATGRRAEHLKVLLSDESCAGDLAEVAALLASGRAVPERARACFALGNMTALLRESVPRRKVRGTVAGDVLRRGVARTLAQQFRFRFETACAPYQFGLGTRAGTDAVALFITSVLDLDEDRVILQLDAKGAFDNMSREAMLQKLREVAPELLPFVLQFYGQASRYLWRDAAGVAHTIHQGSGGEQGDSLMPGLYSVGQHDALEAASARLHPDDLLLAFF